jgi:hypothetical protein
MPSRLSSLLVRDGLVGVKRMEKAFQRQVIYGGSLDTILLEMSLVPEERLVQYLALASGLPPASRDDGTTIEALAITLVSRDIAEQFRAVPLSLDGEAVRVLVCAPLEISELEDLADLLDRPLQPLIAPEYRWHLAFAKAYTLEASARFTMLARQIDTEVTPAPVGRPASIIIDENSVPTVSYAPPPQLMPTPMALDPLGPEEETKRIKPPIVEDRRAKTSTLVGIAPKKQVADAPAIPKSIPVPEPVLEEVEPDEVVEPEPEPAPAPPPTAVPVRVARRDSAPIGTTGRDSPLAIVRARELLATADNRDTVFVTLLRAARARARWAGLLTVQGGAAIGRAALAEPGVDTVAVASVLVPLDSMSPFRAVVQHMQPHVGPLVSGDPSIDSMVLRMGGTMPPSALILPVVLRERVVALIVAHRVHGDLRLADVTELLPLANAASEALGRLIVKHKTAGYRAPVESIDTGPPIEALGVLVDTKRHVLRDGEWSVPAKVEQPIVPELVVIPEPPKPIDDVLDRIERAKENDADDAVSDAVERSHETLGALAKRFPGRLRVDRFTVAGRPLRAAQYGGLLELTVRLGAAAADLLIDKMSAPQRDVRFYATVCVVELRPRTAVFALVERVFDQDFGVRAAALDALSGYPMDDLGDALARARRALHASDPEIVGAATTAIVALGDVEAIGDLVDEVERDDRGNEAVRRALVTLTAQDFGNSGRKWRRWFEGAQRRHRVEWLIEGLLHKVDAIRANAINELRRLTGEYFGYHHDLPRRERDAAAGRWATWWREAGERRFQERDDERRRPTAVVPIPGRDNLS